MRREKEEARAKVAPRLIFTPAAYLPHPEQDAQQSAEGQHEAFAAFTAAVRPNATTASNRIALILFMAFSFLEMKELLSTDSLLSVREGAELYWTILNPQDVGLEEGASSAMPERMVDCERVTKQSEWEIKFRGGDRLALERYR